MDEKKFFQTKISGIKRICSLCKKFSRQAKIEEEKFIKYHCFACGQQEIIKK